MVDRVTAYEDALRNIAAGAIAARRQPHSITALQTFLADVEHHLNTLIVLGVVPPNSGRPITSSADRVHRPELE